MDVIDAEVLAGRYRLGTRLGSGGMGVVRAAIDLRLGRPVAVKLLHPLMAADPSARGRFEDEARAAARLVHPNVVAVFDTGEHDGSPYIVMEILPGRSLADEIGDGPLSVERVRTLAGQVLSALAAAHDAGVVHRDVKPANVLLTADGTAKVADFGIAKTAEGTDHTFTGLVVGTPSYLAPERLLGRPATTRTDLYATGVVLYEALTGHKPTTTDGREPEPALSTARPDADPALVAAIERAMAPASGDRFATADDMAAAIAAAPGHSGSAAAVIVTSAPATTDEVPYTPDTSSNASPRRRRRGALLVALAVTLLALAAVAVVVVVPRSGDGGASSTQGSEAELPEPLEARMRALEESVQP